MPDAVDAGPLGALQLKLPVIGRAVAGAIEKVTQDRGDRFVFALFVATLTCVEWGAITGIKPKTICERYRKGWPVESVLTKGGLLP